jgi:LPPG:FO 2-phospho-L-lactate transferase
LITALAGGVGAARLLIGMAKLVDQKDLTVIVNTGDDIELHGLHVSPDLDIVSYSLSGIVDEKKGWGFRNDTFYCLERLRLYSGFEWFNLGDKDLATHIFRTELLRRGNSLTDVTKEICRALGISARILPMTDDRFETRISTDVGLMHFEEYMVKRGAKDEVFGVEFDGRDQAKPASGVIEAIEEGERVIVCPSNPVVSIGTILSIEGIRGALKKTSAVKVGISPIIGGKPVKGPADKLLKGLGKEVSAFSVAELYADFLDVFVIDHADATDKERIEQLGIKVVVTKTLMASLEDKISLAKTVLEIK